MPRNPISLRAHRRRRQGRKLSLRDAVAMAVGGMIGGGIFSVLGTVVTRAGHLAFLSFVVGGAVALLTARSIAQLSVRTDRSGGLHLYLLDAGFPRLAGLLSWQLLFGYVIALAVYGYTFGHYLSAALGGAIPPWVLSTAMIAVFLAVNLRGLSASALVEDAVVSAKILALAVIAAFGWARFTPAKFEPFNDAGIGGVFIAAAAIFVAYEGFELLSFDYDDTDQPRQTIPRALYLAVGTVMAVYIGVTVGSQLLVNEATITADESVAFNAVGHAALGTAGEWIATLGAVLATGSAVNATLFSTSRQMKELAEQDELPREIGRERNGLPVSALLLLGGAGACFALVPSIASLLTFASTIFLVVFAVTNALAARIATGTARLLAALGCAACLGALTVLLVQMALHDTGTLALTLGCIAALTLARWLFTRHGGQ